MKRVVLFVAGQGDALAIPVLVKRLLTEMEAWDCVYLDPDPFVVRSVGRLVRDRCRNWLRWLGAAAKRRDLGAVLLVLDGDDPTIHGQEFCAAEVARRLAQEATRARGGDSFSVAVVFARQEYESWLIAAVESLSDRRLKDGRAGVKPGLTPPTGDLEVAPRNAKGWLGDAMVSGYSPVKDQALLTEIADLEQIRSRPMRSFRRLENATRQIVLAIRDDHPLTSPS